MQRLAWAAAAAALPSAVPAQAVNPPLTTAEQWLDEALSTRGLGAPMRLSRFVEPVYFVLSPGITWTPNQDNGPQYTTVNVPEGFVTDLASIPPILFSVFRADGDYAQAAIVHDYLYWTQRTTRAYADDVFRIAMRDLEVRPATIQQIYAAVRSFGQASWEQNAKLKRGGEHRFLKNFPALAATRWINWKRDPENFHMQDL
jgi:hypothetical protein